MEREIYAKDDILCIKRGKESSIGSKIQIDIGRSGAINKKTQNFKLTNLLQDRYIVVGHRAITESKEFTFDLLAILSHEKTGGRNYKLGQNYLEI